MKAKTIGLLMAVILLTILISSCTFEGMTVLEEGVASVVVQLADFVKEVSPLVWATAVRQAYVVGIRDVVVGLILIGLTIVSVKLARWSYPKHQEAIKERPRSYEGEYAIALWICALLSLIAGTIGFVILLEGLTVLANPHFEAIKILLELI